MPNLCLCPLAVSHECPVGLKGRGSFGFGGNKRQRGEARGEEEKILSPFTRFRITKKSRGAVGKRRRWNDREREREKHRELEMKRETMRPG